MAAWNVLVLVADLVAGSAGEAIGKLRARLASGGLSPYEGEPGCSAFESQEEE